MTDKITAEDVEKAVQEQSNPTPASVEDTQEVKPEPKIEQSVEVEVKEVPEVKETEATPEPSKPVEIPKSLPQVPLSTYIKEEKKRKALEARIKELESAPAKKEEAKDYEESVYNYAKKNNWTQEQYEAKLEENNAMLAPLLKKLEGYDSVAKELQEQKSEKEVNVWADSKVDDNRAEIEKLHGEMSEDEYKVIRGKIKNKIINEGLIETPITTLYKLISDEIKPPRKAVESPSNKKSSIKAIDTKNPSVDDIQGGNIDAVQMLQDMKSGKYD